MAIIINLSNFRTFKLINIFFRGKQLKDYVGKNDKTKVVIKLAIIGAGEALSSLFLISFKSS